MSDNYLSVKAAKLLIVSGIDRLDKPLTIGQIQGKFQMQIVKGSGHNVQEDYPDKVCEHLLAFWSRNQKLDLSKIVKVNSTKPQNVK